MITFSLIHSPRQSNFIELISKKRIGMYIIFYFNCRLLYLFQYTHTVMVYTWYSSHFSIKLILHLLYLFQIFIHHGFLNSPSIRIDNDNLMIIFACDISQDLICDLRFICIYQFLTCACWYLYSLYF